MEKGKKSGRKKNFRAMLWYFMQIFFKQIDTINHFISGILKNDKQILQDLRNKKCKLR